MEQPSWFEKKLACPGYQCDVSRRMRLSYLLRQLEQISTDHLSSFGQTYEYLYEAGMVFVLVKLMVDIRRQPEIDEEIRLETCPAGKKGAQLLRVSRVLDEQGRLLAECLSCWVIIDPVSRKILRPDRFQFPQGVLCVPVDYKPSAHRTARPERWEGESRTMVCYSQLDYNEHLNNAAYADVVMDALPPEEVRRPVRRFQIDYLHEVRWGEELLLQTARVAEGHWAVAGRTADREIFQAEILFE